MKKVVLLIVFVMATMCFGYNYYQTNKTRTLNGDLNSDPFARTGQQQVTKITNAQTKLLFTTPIKIVDAPPTGFALSINSVDLFTNYDTNMFDANSDVIGAYFYNNAAYTACTGTVTHTLLLQTAAADRHIHLLGTATQNAAALDVNDAVYLKSLAGDPNGTTSKSTLTVVVSYDIVPTGF